MESMCGAQASLTRPFSVVLDLSVRGRDPEAPPGERYNTT